MRRVLSFAAAVVMTASALGLAAGGVAQATTPAAAGDINCRVRGDITFTPALPSASNVDGLPSNGRFKGLLGIQDCNTSGVTGGKAPITTGTIQVSGKIPAGEGCWELPGPPDMTSFKTNMVVRWQGTK